MHGKHLLVIIALGMLQPGCAFYRYAFENLTQAPVDTCEDRQRLRAFREAAQQVWLRVVAFDPTRPYHPEFVEGFEDGFVDYLDAGGPGDPPAVPPWRFRRHKYESVEGRQAILAWNGGFRYGAAVAQASGLRELVVVPVPLPPRVSGYPILPPPWIAPPSHPEQTPPDGPEVLPAPRGMGTTPPPRAPAPPVEGAPDGPPPGTPQ